MGLMRLDKMLANEGVGTRSEVKLLLKKGRVTVNGQTVKKPEMKVDSEKDEICLDGNQIFYQEYEYYMFHKPAGCVSATFDNHDKTVMDYLPKDRKEDLFPVGRLDKDTEGLLLITNDGALAHQLLAPGRHVDKVYQVRTKGTVLEEHTAVFEEGMDIGDEKKTLPAELEILESGEYSEAKVTIREGRFHQVKRMFQRIGCEVIYLKRLSMGSLILDEKLEKGTYRPLTKEELEGLKGHIC